MQCSLWATGCCMAKQPWGRRPVLEGEEVVGADWGVGGYVFMSKEAKNVWRCGAGNISYIFINNCIVLTNCKLSRIIIIHLSSLTINRTFSLTLSAWLKTMGL